MRSTIRSDNGCGRRLGRRRNAHRARIRRVRDAAPHAAIRHRWAGRDAISNQAAPHARVRVQSHGGFRDGQRDQGEVVLCQVCSFTASFLHASWLIVEWGSYDLELDTRLSEETTVLVESYTVGFFPSFSSFYYTELA